MDPLIGKEVGNYRILRELARGGMGVVYAGEHRLIGEAVAIKVLTRPLADDPNLLERVRREARSVHLISGDGVVKTRDMGTLPDGTTYIVMELLLGESLFARLQRQGGRLPLETAFQITLQIAQTMMLVHAKGLVHRDLKPENIFLTTSSSDRSDEIRTKVLDFGIVKLRSPAQGDEQYSQPTTEGALVGTFRYMAPEQYLSAKDVDGQADVYALGIMLFQMLAGRLPFDETNGLALAIWHTKMTPPPLSQFVPNLPATVADLVARMLAKSPSARPNMAEVARTSKRLLGARESGAQSIWAEIPRTVWIGLAICGAAAAFTTWLLIHRISGGQARGQARPDGATTDARQASSELPDGATTTSPVPPPLPCPLRTIPEGASIRRADNRHLLGQTPLETFSMPAGTQSWVTIERSGFHDESLLITRDICLQNRPIKLRAIQAESVNKRRNGNRTSSESGAASAGKVGPSDAKSSPKPPPTVKIKHYEIPTN